MSPVQKRSMPSWRLKPLLQEWFLLEQWLGARNATTRLKARSVELKTPTSRNQGTHEYQGRGSWEGDSGSGGRCDKGESPREQPKLNPTGT